MVCAVGFCEGGSGEIGTAGEDVAGLGNLSSTPRDRKRRSDAGDERIMAEARVLQYLLKRILFSNSMRLSLNHSSDFLMKYIIIGVKVATSSSSGTMISKLFSSSGRFLNLAFRVRKAVLLCRRPGGALPCSVYVVCSVHDTSMHWECATVCPGRQLGPCGVC